MGSTEALEILKVVLCLGIAFLFCMPLFEALAGRRM